MEQPSYYSILTAAVRYDQDLTPNAKLLYSEITALSNKKGKCWASNGYFAKLYKVSNTSISKWIRQLAQKKYIEVKMLYVPGTKQIDKRMISVAPIEDNLNRPITKVKEGVEVILNSPIEVKLKDNITSNNTTSNNRESKPSSINEVESYFKLKNFDLREVINFYEYYESNGWKVGRNPMKKWKLAANRWARKAKKSDPGLAETYFPDFLHSQNKNKLK